MKSYLMLAEIMESVTPKLSDKDFKTPIIFGTSREFKESDLTWFHWWEEEPTFKKFNDEKEQR